MNLQRTVKRKWGPDEFVCLLFFHTQCESSVLAGELPEESDYEGYYSHRFDYTVFHTSPLFFNPRREPPLLPPSLVLFPNTPSKRHLVCVHFEIFIGFTVHHGVSVIFIPLTLSSCHVYRFVCVSVCTWDWTTHIILIDQTQ
jgi:hypothetical protein